MNELATPAVRRQIKYFNRRTATFVAFDQNDTDMELKWYNLLFSLKIDDNCRRVVSVHVFEEKGK